GAAVEAGVVDVLDGDLDVVFRLPLLDPGVVEPVVVGRDEVDPLDDREVALEPAPLELQRAGEREGRRRARGAHRRRADARFLQQVAPAAAPRLLSWLALAVGRAAPPFCD